MKYFKSLTSTSDYIKEHVNELDNFECVLCDEQTKGRGRDGHTWESHVKKNAMFSILIKDQKIIKKFNLLSVITGLTIAEYLETVGLSDVMIKWPNDVLVNDLKIAGILLEGNIPQYIIVGIGLNVNQTSFPHFPATSIKNEIQENLDTRLVVNDLFDLLKTRYKSLGDDLYDYIDDYNDKDYLLDKEITFMKDGELCEGIAKGIDLDGSLKVIYNNKTINVFSNEVNLIRKK